MDTIGLHPQNIVYYVAASSHLISNDIVLVPQCWQAGEPEIIRQKDQTVLAILEELYPDRKIQGIHSVVLNWAGGGMHCRYQPQPKLQ
ncbi:MAG: agmatine deiminase family protein [Cyclobacteriaceae bacterium]|jgi:agmatine deiminase